MKFPDMRTGVKFHGAVIQEAQVGELSYLDDDTAKEFQTAQDKLSRLDGSARELELIHVYRSLKNTGIMHNPIDVVIDDKGRKVIMRGNQRYVALLAMGYDGPIPYRVWKRVGDIPQYVIQDGAVRADIQQLMIYPKPHVKAKRILNLPRGQVSILPTGSLMISRTEYDLIKTQLSPEDYTVVEHDDSI